MLDRKQVYEMLDREHQYAQGWGRDDNKGSNMVSIEDGQPYGLMDWLVFAEKYTEEAKLAWSNYTPDRRAVRIRLLKAASLLVTALQVHGQESDLQDIAGVSSTQFPIHHGGLRAFYDETQTG